MHENAISVISERGEGEPDVALPVWYGMHATRYITDGNFAPSPKTTRSNMALDTLEK